MRSKIVMYVKICNLKVQFLQRLNLANFVNGWLAKMNLSKNRIKLRKPSHKMQNVSRIRPAKLRLHKN